MLRYARFPVTRWYAVEVSGWDRTENFFVERCELEWKEESDKQVTLKRALFDNAVLLVRLLQFDESGRSHPVVFEAEWVRRTKSGLHKFRLNTVVPRRREPESSAHRNDTVTQSESRSTSLRCVRSERPPPETKEIARGSARKLMILFGTAKTGTGPCQGPREHKGRRDGTNVARGNHRGSST
jgi:hypothetical protein